MDSTGDSVGGSEYLSRKGAHKVGQTGKEGVPCPLVLEEEGEKGTHSGVSACG